MKQFRSAKKRITVSAGESVRIIRELQGLSQNQLAQRTGIPQATLSAIENDRVRLGVERAKVLATQNFISFAAILWASAALWIMEGLLNFSPAQVMGATGIFTLGIIVGIMLFSKETRQFVLSSLIPRI
mgnify:CR=1 FL=1